MCRSVPVLGERFVDQLVLVALPGHVPSEAEERGDVDSVDVLRVLHVAAQIKLCQNRLPRLLLKETQISDRCRYTSMNADHFNVNNRAGAIHSFIFIYC